MIAANEAKKITEKAIVELEKEKIVRTQAWADAYLSKGIEESAKKGLCAFTTAIPSDVSLAHLEVILYHEGFSTERVTACGGKLIKIFW